MTQENDKSPKKQQPRASGARKKKTSKSKTDRKSDEYKKKIQDAIKVNLDEYLKQRNINQKQITSINAIIEEHLSCFILVGYTDDGEPITLVNAATQKDSDSLGTILHKVIKKYSDPPNNLPLL